MQSDRELMQQALEALEYVHEGANNQGPHTGISWRCASNKVEPAITALRERLAQPEQELKPWQTEETYDNDGVLIARRMKRGPNCEWEPWLTPPRREWVGLTEEEAFACRGRDYFETYRAIEAKLKDKNNAD